MKKKIRHQAKAKRIRHNQNADLLFYAAFVVVGLLVYVGWQLQVLPGLGSVLGVTIGR